MIFDISIHVIDPDELASASPSGCPMFGPHFQNLTRIGA